jgi:hypothetical protein
MLTIRQEISPCGKSGVFYPEGSMGGLTLSLRGGSVSDRRGNPSSLGDERTGLSVRLLMVIGSPRAYALAMTRVVFYHEGSEVVECSHYH